MDKVILYMFALAIFITGCKKEPKQVNTLPYGVTQADLDKPVVRVDDQEILDYFYSYKNNSWWVYEDEATGERDSAFMISSDMSGLIIQESSDKNTERINYTIKWRKLPIMYVYLESSLNQNVYSISYVYRSGDIIKDNGVYRTKDTVNNSIKFIDSMKINDFTFTNVLEVKIGGVFYYYAKNVGLIRRNITFAAKDYKLKKYQIK